VGDDASSRSLDVQAGQLREFVADLAARVAAIEAARDRAERRDRIEEILATAGQPPGPRHAAPKHRERPDWLRVIPGGMAALVPMPGHGAAGFLPAAGHVFLGRRAWPRWAVAALAFGLAGAVAAPTAADVRDTSAVVCASRCGDGEGGPQPLVQHHVHARVTDRLIMIRHDLGHP
jgi:hypothetical protein